PLEGRRIAPSSPLPLTGEQSAALDVVLAAAAQARDASAPVPRPVLLRGVTASGKTEVYLQAMAEVLRHGGGAIVLVPEISLTPQTIRRFVSRFGSVVAVLHSRLGAGERHDEWHRIRSGEARIVVGPRSALFAPVRNLGLIVVDEEHEQSYKQDETPRYNARDVAAVRARIERCALVLGSATPSLESWHNAATGKYALCEMAHRAVAMQMPRVTVVDMREEALRCEGRTPVFSEVLVSAVRERLRSGEQTMLLLNRRGFAPTVSCVSCGHVETCDNCSVSMTLHSADRVLRCHVCGAWRPVPKVCPECASGELRRGGVGTQRVEEVAQKIFPGARIARMDLDVTTRKRSHEEILAEFRAGRTDILVGTQMIAKGLDFPNVTLAGILSADSGLSIPDFRASERTFQLLAQMAGRAGRGTKPGDVVIQTFSPGHPAVECAATEDFARFAEVELKDRKSLCYPPFSHLDCITVRGGDRAAAEAYAARLSAAIGTQGDWRLGAPVPAALERAKGQWRFQMVLRGDRPALLNSRIAAALAASPPPRGVAVAVDIDAVGAF
ncbi:MAG: primosomal protein N', partial [Kiritimatiellae bacterium]|nr:primosomal protein N' [Kiritimatiellia bacterium]